MKFRKTISLLVLCIAVLSLIAAICGIFSKQGPGEYNFTSIHGQTITIYGKGIYGKNSVFGALQAISQDIVTLCVGIPILIISLFLARKGLIKGRLLLSGTLGYFLITYMMYTFIAMYNKLFLAYVVLMSASFFAFVLTLPVPDIEKMSSYFSDKLPVRFAGGYLIFSTAMIGLLWLARVIPTLIDGSVPLEVEHGTTLTVQAFDLAFFLPGIFLSGLLLIKKKPFGYILAPIATVTNALIMAALLSKGISMNLAGIEGALPLIVMTSLFGLLAIVSLILIFKNVNEPVQA
ncbi:MAG: hypothetical protein ACM3XR_09090 [Bacillota bacterium]